jgi:hypothetical protein
MAMNIPIFPVMQRNRHLENSHMKPVSNEVTYTLRYFKLCAMVMSYRRLI